MHSYFTSFLILSLCTWYHGEKYKYKKTTNKICKRNQI